MDAGKVSWTELEFTMRALWTLRAVAEALLSADDEDALLQDVCAVVVKVGGYGRAWAGLTGDGVDGLRVVGSYDAEHGSEIPPDPFLSLHQKGGGPVGRSMSERVPIAEDRLPESREDAALVTQDAPAPGRSSVISLPLIGRDGESLGALAIYDGRTGAFRQQELELLESLAADLVHGIGIVRDRRRAERVERELRRSHAHLEQMVRDVVEAMGRIVEARDPHTLGHEQRVSALAGQIAVEMGLPEEQVTAIEIAGLLHDIGKIGVPAEILTRAGVLSASELDLIREHPRRGWEILKDISFPWPIAEIVLQHQERMDGSGYPEGLAQDEISVAARILTVADVVEAMASHRPYRPALGLEMAMEEITGRPETYDPTVVQACLELYRDVRIGL